MKSQSISILSAILLVGSAFQAKAGPEAPATTATKEEMQSPFTKGVTEVDLMAGTFLSYTPPGGAGRKSIDFAQESVRIGRMLTSPKDTGFFSGLLRGNFEFLFEGIGGEVYSGHDKGSTFGGVSFLMRYNFVHPGCRIIPFYELGGGMVFNNIYLDNSQREVGESFEFNLQNHAGVDFMLRENLALTLEGGWTHISNANMADRNLGLDTFGGLFGVCYFF